MHRLAAAALSVLSTAAFGQNLITNGSFEAPAVSPGSFLAFVVGSNLGGWSVFGNGSAVMSLSTTYAEPNVVFTAQSGLVAIDLTGAANTGTTNAVSQVVTTTPGQAYQLDFFIGNADGSGNVSYGLPSSVLLSINGVSISTFVNADTTIGTINWKPFSIGFTAVGGSTTIAFTNATPSGDNYAGLDNVVLTAVSEPHPLLLGLVGLPLVGWARTRFGKRGALTSS